MKPGRKMMIAMSLMFTALTATYALADETGTTNETALQLLCSPELTVLANDLADQYMQDKDGVAITVAEIPDTGEPVFPGEGKIALVTKGTVDGTEKEQLFRMVIGRQVIVPVMNVKHPQKDLILQKGISPDQFARIYMSSGITWGSILETASNNPVNAYVPGDPGSRKYLADFIKAVPAQIKGREMGDAGTMLAKIESDPNAIGFCSMAMLLELEQNGENSGICLVPVDVDGNGQLTQFENIYAGFSDLSHGIYVGKYPRELYSRVYAVTEGQAVAGEELAFLEWVISGGQASLASASMMKLDFGDRVSGKEDLSALSNPVADLPVKTSSARTIFLLLCIVLIGAILLSQIVKRTRKKDTEISGFQTPVRPVFGKGSMHSPAGLFYDKSHTWTFMEKEGNVRIGIDDFLQNVTGTVTRVVMKNPGEKISRGEPFLTLTQNGKQLKIKSPVTGTVVDQNQELLDDASLINDEPYAAGWVYTVEPVNWFKELKVFFMGESYTEWLKAELTRLKEFFSAGCMAGSEKDVVVAMQDGGEIREGALEAFGPEVWEEFQTRFINRS